MIFFKILTSSLFLFIIIPIAHADTDTSGNVDPWVFFTETIIKLFESIDDLFIEAEKERDDLQKQIDKLEKEIDKLKKEIKKLKKK